MCLRKGTEGVLGDRERGGARDHQVGGGVRSYTKNLRGRARNEGRGAQGRGRLGRAAVDVVHRD